MKKISKKLFEELTTAANNLDESGLTNESRIIDAVIANLFHLQKHAEHKDLDGDGLCDLCGSSDLKVACSGCGDTKCHPFGGDDGVIKRASFVGQVGGGVAGGATGAVSGAAKGAVVGGGTGAVVGGVVVGGIVGVITPGVGAAVGGAVGAGGGAVIGGSKGTSTGMVVGGAVGVGKGVQPEAMQPQVQEPEVTQSRYS